MAFCTKCGASLTGTFCSQCGTPAGGQQQAAPAPAPPRKTSPIVWVLIVLLCLFGAGILAVIGTGAYVAHRMRQAGVDRELFRRDPQRALARLLANHPDLEVTETGRDGITVRNRRNGKSFTMSFDDARSGRFRLEGIDEDGHGGSIEVGGDAKIPSWVPQYPGSRPEPMLSARGSSPGGAGEAGEFRFDTADSPSDVLSFYEARGREMGLTLHTVRVGEKVTLATADDEHDRMLKVIARREGDQTSVNVTYGRKR